MSASRHGADSESPIRLAVLLVGGLGTRLRPLTYRLPKALIPVANLPLIAYEIIPLVRAGVTRIVFALGYQAERLAAGLGDGSDWGAEFVYVQEPEPLGTAGALGNCRQHLDEPFFALNGDLIYDLDYAALARAHDRFGAMVTFCLRQTPDIQHYGLIVCDDGGRVREFREKVACDETGRNTVNSGVYVMSPEVLTDIPTGQAYSAEQDLFPRLLGSGAPLQAHLPERGGYWADVGRTEAYLQVNGDILDGALSWFEPCPLGVISPTAAVAGSVDLTDGVTVGDGAVVGPRVAAGDCTIEEGAVVSNSILWPGSRIGAGAVVRDSVIAGVGVAPGRVVTGEVMVD